MTTNTWLRQVLTKCVTPSVSHLIHYKIEICIFLNWSACEVREHSYGFHWLRKTRKHRFRHSHSLNFDIHNFLKTTGFSLFYMMNIDVDRVVFWLSWVQVYPWERSRTSQTIRNTSNMDYANFDFIVYILWHAWCHSFRKELSQSCISGHAFGEHVEDTEPDKP